MDVEDCEGLKLWYGLGLLFGTVIMEGRSRKVFGRLVWLIFWVCIIFKYPLFDHNCVGSTCVCGPGAMGFGGVFVASWILLVYITGSITHTGATRVLGASIGLAGVISLHVVGLIARVLLDMLHLLEQGADVDLLTFVDSSFFADGISTDLERVAVF